MFFPGVFPGIFKRLPEIETVPIAGIADNNGSSKITQNGGVALVRCQRMKSAATAKAVLAEAPLDAGIIHALS